MQSGDNTLKLREIEIIDRTGCINVGLWRNMAETFDENVLRLNSVVIFKHARVSEFGGRSLSAGNYLEINSKLPEAEDLQEWYSEFKDKTKLPKLSTKDVIAVPASCIGLAQMLQYGV